MEAIPCLQQGFSIKTRERKVETHTISMLTGEQDRTMENKAKNRGFYMENRAKIEDSVSATRV